MKIAYATTPRGYRLTAIIPFTLLGWEPTNGFRGLEISICAKPDAGSPRTWTRVFGVEAWMKEKHRFAVIGRFGSPYEKKEDRK